MPTPEEIKKKIEFFTYNRDDDFYTTSEQAKMLTEFVDFLSKDYCIVPKSQIKQWYYSAKGTADYFPNAPRVSPLNRAKATIEILGRLFGKSLFEEEK